MDILFIGWNENGERCLESLLKRNFNVKKVIVPTGYYTKKMFDIAIKNNIKIVESDGTTIKLKEEILESKPDLIIIASFPKLINKGIINIPKLGCINVHAAALPQYRGYHPINWAIIKDEKEIGVTVHYIDEGMDSGDILEQKKIPISNFDDVNTLRNKLTLIGAKLLIKTVKKISRSKKKIKGIKQDENNISYAPKRKPEDGKINWQKNTRDIFNLTRALESPYPNAFAFNSNREKIEFEKNYISKEAGKVIGKIKGYYLITTGDGVILLKTKQKLRVGEKLK